MRQFVRLYSRPCASWNNWVGASVSLVLRRRDVGGESMASVTAYETKAGRRWRVRYRTPDRRQTDKRGFATKRDARAFAATIEVRKAMGTFVSPAAGRVTVDELAAAWLEKEALRGLVSLPHAGVILADPCSPGLGDAVHRRDHHDRGRGLGHRDGTSMTWDDHSASRARRAVRNFERCGEVPPAGRQSSSRCGEPAAPGRAPTPLPDCV